MRNIFVVDRVFMCLGFYSYYINLKDGKKESQRNKIRKSEQAAEVYVVACLFG